MKRPPSILAVALACLAATGAPCALGHTEPAAAAVPVLSPDQSRLFRSWLVRAVDQQLAQGPSARWQHRDCAGLVRFAVLEAFRDHDERWRRAARVSGPTPPALALTDAQKGLRNRWQRADGTTSAYVGALELVQENARFVSKDLNLAQPGDLLFFDQGDEQHLMIWTGRYVAYHTGTAVPGDDGLRVVSPRELLTWKDNRWHPVQDNPNFVGVFRLRFLSR